MAIVGNGILGLMTAFELSCRDPNLKIAVIGPDERTGSASAAAGAMLGCFGEITSLTFKTAQSQSKFDLAREAHGRWPALLEALNDLLPDGPRLENNRGTFVILNSCSGRIESENFDAMRAALARYQEPFEEVDPAIIEGLKPNQSKRPLRALYLADEGMTDARRLMEALRGILERRQVRFVDQGVAGFARDGAGYAIALDNGETVRAARCLLAAGAFIQQLLDAHPDLARAIPRLFPGVGVSMVLSQDPAAPVRQVVRTPNRAGACGLHVLPLADGSLYLGASNDLFISPQTAPMAGIVHFLLDCAMEQINPYLYRSTPGAIRTGNRPVTVDGFPLIGRTSWEGLYILSGTYRDGFHQSPVLAAMIADEILGSPQARQHSFQPERDLIRSMTKEEAVQVYLDHLLAAYYEHGWDVAKIASEGAFRHAAEAAINAQCAELDIEFGFSPDFLLMHELTSAPDLARVAMAAAQRAQPA